MTASAIKEKPWGRPLLLLGASMPELEKITYRVKDKGGAMGGQQITFEAPIFDLEAFIKTPNADEFIKKAYYTARKNIAREIEERKNGSRPVDLSSYEMIIARSLNFTKADVMRWLQTRDWSRIAHFKDPEGLRNRMEKFLPALASRINHFQEKASKIIAEKVIAALADKPDPIAEYLFVILTVERPDDSVDLSLL